MSAQLSETIDQAEPPGGLSKSLQAMWWLKKGKLKVGPEWEQAHLICQYEEGNPEMDLVHALAHWIEADLGNADYWYRRAGTKRAKPSVAEEWDFIVDYLSSSHH